MNCPLVEKDSLELRMLMKYLEEYIFDGLGQRFQVFLSHYTVHRLAVHIPC